MAEPLASDSSATSSGSDSSVAQSTAIRNCDDVYNGGARIDGVYTIYTGEKFVEVYCEFQLGGPNWMVSLKGQFY